MDTRKKARKEIMACLGLICTSSSQPIRLVLNRDCIEGMRDLPDNSVHSVVCDPPYGLAFMGREWDSFVGNLGFQEAMKAWAVEAIRVLKPGGHLLAFGGTKTYHRLACGLEDAGFEIRDCLMWLYGSGFPKSLDVSKAIDKQAGVEREVVRTAKAGALSGNSRFNLAPVGTISRDHGNPTQGYKCGDVGYYDVTAPATEAARQWEGWGTALKPAWEPIIMARKPLSGTVASNVVEWGTGALNIDQCRVTTSDTIEQSGEKVTLTRAVIAEGYDRPNRTMYRTDKPKERSGPEAPLGRWPANLVHDGSDEVVEMFPQSGGGAFTTGGPPRSDSTHIGQISGQPRTDAIMNYGDSGSAARFFYCAKPSSRERDAGLEAFDPKYAGKWNGGGIGERRRQAGLEVRKNIHPTVKPRALMAYLIRLVTPEGGVVLDPFAGSGTTGCAAAVVAGTRFLGFELSREYAGIANARIAHSEANASVKPKPKADKPAKKKPAVVEPEPKPEKSDNLFRFTLGDPAKALKALGHKAKTSGK